MTIAQNGGFLMFSKKKDKFMVQLEEMVFNLDRAAIEFGKMDFNTHLDLKAYSDNIKTYESHGDELMHQVISNSTKHSLHQLNVKISYLYAMQ